MLARSAPQLADPRDRALLHALVQAGARGWLRYDAALDRLLDKPLKRKAPAVHALLVLGLVQLDVLELPAYAAVAATVQAARALGKPRLAGLVNAVLRRWQREADSLQAQPGPRPGVALVAAGLVHRGGRARLAGPGRTRASARPTAKPPLTLRVNRRHGSREALLSALREAGVAAHAHPELADAVVLAHSTDVTRLPGFDSGDFAVQDGAAQLATDLLDLADGQRVLDACAAPGGKACHALERHALDLVAVELDGARVPRIRENLARLDLRARVIEADAALPDTWWDDRPFDRILVDAPCSATGVLRRRPDVRLHRRAGDIAALNTVQTDLLEALWPLLAPGGRLVYATCSLLRAENEAIVAPFLAAHDDAVAVPLHLPMGQAAGPGWQVLPGDADLDGMYYAAIAKRTR